jgi:hypothetical protein
VWLSADPVQKAIDRNKNRARQLMLRKYTARAGGTLYPRRGQLQTLLSLFCLLLIVKPIDAGVRNPPPQQYRLGDSAI